VAGRLFCNRQMTGYEIWAQTLGGVLEVSGIEGFLGNLDEMMAASDTEGGAWRAFVQTWWDRFGTAEVSVSDLFGYAKAADPALPFSGKEESAQRISFGLALRKLRDRAFRISDLMVHVRSGTTSHSAQRWRLSTSPKSNMGKPSPPSPPSTKEGRVEPVRGGLKLNPSPVTTLVECVPGEGVEGGEGCSSPYTCAHTHMNCTGAGKPSPPSPPSPNPDLTWVSGGEGLKPTLPTLPEPSWLDGVP